MRRRTVTSACRVHGASNGAARGSSRRRVEGHRESSDSSTCDQPHSGEHMQDGEHDVHDMCAPSARSRKTFQCFFSLQIACLLAPLSLVPSCEIMDPCTGHPTFQSLACCACTLCVDHLCTSGTQARCSHERGEASSSGLDMTVVSNHLPLLRASRPAPTRHRPLPHHMS